MLSERITATTMMNRAEQQVDGRFQELQQQGRQPARHARQQHGGEEGRLVPRQILAPDAGEQRPQRLAGVGMGDGNGHRPSVERLRRQVKRPRARETALDG